MMAATPSSPSAPARRRARSITASSSSSDNAWSELPRRIPEDPGVPGRLEETWQEGVLGLQTHQHQDIRPVEQHRKARLHRHGMNIFDAGGNTRDLDEGAPHDPGPVR